jgi:hypothetical protein
MAAQAAPKALFGNTLQIKLANGTVLKVLVDADGTYSRIGPDGSTVTGTWAETGEQICFTPQKPEPRPAVCMPRITQAVGATWSIQLAGGAATAMIIAGR